MKKTLYHVLSAAVLLFISSAAAEETKADTMNEYEKATFAGGCFWCTESDFQKVDGVIEVVSGYTGGKEKNPTYYEVASGTTGHAECVQVTYDPGKVSYERLLEIFWRHIDPTDSGGQFVDRGSQYRPAIFYHYKEQKAAAEKSKKVIDASEKFNKPVVVGIVKLEKFYPAEDYHQDFYKKSPVRYNRYRSNSGRDQFLDRIWSEIEASGTVPENTE